MKQDLKQNSSEGNILNKGLPKFSLKFFSPSSMLQKAFEKFEESM